MSRSASTIDDLESGVRAELESFVREIKGARALARIAPEASLERDLGLGSLERMELFSRLERRLGVRAPESSFAVAETVRDLLAAFATGADAHERRDRVGALRRSDLAPPESATSLGEVLRRRAEAEPDVPHVLLEPEGGSDDETLSFGELYRDALAVAGGLGERGVAASEPVAIMLPTGRDFFVAFMGTLLAGAVPVPLYPPFNLARIAEYARRQAGILTSAGARVFVTLAEGVGVGRHLESTVPSLRDVVTVDALLAEARSASPLPVGAEAPALIQYTSGSTGDPKGVLLSHGNLLANIRAIGRALRIGPEDVGVSWLPLYHDMGLIGAWLTPMYFGIPVSILSPIAFLARPEKWLWTIHRRRGTISPAPNFAYEICRRKIPEAELEGLDLSSWRVALNGAEPISPETLDGFARRFSRCGFRENAFLPVYGLAESSLLLAAPALGAPVRVFACEREPFEREGVAISASANARRPLRFVSVGRPIPGHDLRIVDDAGVALPERREGRLWFRGPSVSAGYYGNESASAALRREGGFLDSGDRAFIDAGELFVTGRAKDLIIKAGRNLIPQELEAVAARAEGVRAGSVAAFGIADETTGTERIVLLAECRSLAPEVVATVRREIETALVDAFGLTPDDVVILPPRALPKTSSGKLRRSACKASYLEGRLAGRDRGARALAAKLWLSDLAARTGRLFASARRTAYGLYVGLWTAAFIGPMWLASLVLPRDALRRVSRRASRSYLALVGMRLDVSGGERLRDAAGPAIFVVNHASYLDPLPIMAVLDTDYAFVVKEEVFTWPLVGRFIRKLGHVPVSRATADERLLGTKAMEAALAAGRSLVVFPEGTFTYATGLRPFHLGAFHLAAETGRPIVPLALVGTRRWLRDGSFVPRRGALSLLVFEPRTVERSFEAVLRARDDTAATLAREVGEPRLDLASASLAQMEYP